MGVLVFSHIGLQNAVELGLVLGKSLSVPAAHPHPKIFRVHLPFRGDLLILVWASALHVGDSLGLFAHSLRKQVKYIKQVKYTKQVIKV